MPSARKSDTGPPQETIMSPAGSVLLTGLRPVGSPASAIPPRTVSTKRGSSAVPNPALKIWTQCGAHPGVAAPAGSGPALARPPATVRVDAATSTFFVMDMRRSSSRAAVGARARPSCWELDDGEPTGLRPPAEADGLWLQSTAVHEWCDPPSPNRWPHRPRALPGLARRAPGPRCGVDRPGEGQGVSLAR